MVAEHQPGQQYRSLPGRAIAALPTGLPVPAKCIALGRLLCPDCRRPVVYNPLKVCSSRSWSNCSCKPLTRMLIAPCTLTYHLLSAFPFLLQISPDSASACSSFPLTHTCLHRALHCSVVFLRLCEYLFLLLASRPSMFALLVFSVSVRVGCLPHVLAPAFHRCLSVTVTYLCIPRDRPSRTWRLSHPLRHRFPSELFRPSMCLGCSTPWFA